MSTQSKAVSADNVITQRITAVPLLFAVVLGSSLIEFNHILIPPDITSLSFWAFIIVWLSAFASWLAYQEAALSFPYTRRRMARLRAAIEAIGAGVWAFILFFASQAEDSLFGYLWGFVLFFILLMLVYLIRRREWHLPESIYASLGRAIKHGIVILATAVAYSIWTLLFKPIPEVAVWIILFIPFAITISLRSPQLFRELPAGVPSNQH